MKNYYSTSLVRLVCVGLLVSSIVPDGFSQHYATAYNGRQDSFRYEASTLRSVQGEEQSISLKAALRDLKKRYHIKFAYKEGLLDGKVVSLSLLNDDQQSPEVLVQKILTQCRLEYRQITKNQFTIFPVAPAQDGKAQGENGATQVPGASPVSVWQSETLETALLAVTGKVSSDEGEALPGVNVLLKGTTTGTTTDASGVYSLNVPEEGGTLVFSFIGFKTQEVQVTNQTTVDVVLASDAETLNEVVVTALGIQKEKKALGYSVTEVKGEEFTQAREVNIANALSGKIAGVSVTGMSTGPGGSSRVIIRGNGSLTGANQPLYVINGMPMDNTTPGGSPTTNEGSRNIDRGDGISGINPDDIESITVLKGGTSAALYGSRAANGVILITTKKGRAQRGIGVEYNSTFTMDQVAVTPDWQYEYGQGTGGLKPTTQAEALNSGRNNWGAKIDGSDFVAADGKTHSYVAQKDNIKNFYKTGTNFTNTLAFTGGNENITYRFSLSDMNSKAILPNSTYNRKTANLNIGGQLSKKIKIDVLAQYNLEKAHNRPSAGDAIGNPNWAPYFMANTSDLRWFAPGYDDKGNEIIFTTATVVPNSYFIVNKFQEDDTKNRFIGQASIQYNLLDNLSVKGTVSRDFYNYNYRNILPTGTAYIPLGEYAALKTDVAETNSMLTINYQTNISEDFSITALAGGNKRNNQYRELNTFGTQFIIPYFYSATNLTTSLTKPKNYEIATNSLFGSLDLGYKNMAFLTVTGRQDWFSTLSPEHNSIFYPSVSGSFLLSEAVQLPRVFDYAKMRGSWASVGGGAPDPYAINLTYSMIPGSSVPLQNVTQTDNLNVIYNSNLKPYTTHTFEIGMDLQFLSKRLGLDFAYYERKTTDDIVRTEISGTSGYNFAYLNVGELKNKGIEMLLTGTPVQTGSFRWDVSYNLAHNTNEVVKLAPGLNSIQMATTVNNYGYINNVVGRPFGVLMGTKMLRDDNGNIVYTGGANGVPVKTGLQEFGQGVAPLTMGFSNEFSYKNFSLNILVDGKFGNKVLSVMEVYAMRLGFLKATLPGRAEGLEVSGVTADGAAYTRTVAPANISAWYENQKNYSELFVHDGSFVKLRQVIFTYKIPVQNFKLFKIQSASISFVGRNLAILYKKTDNFDPEQGYTNGSGQGFESIALPRTRNYGVNLMVKF
jgi:TonB-linked SusC/RagA family outer membrane protein